MMKRSPQRIQRALVFVGTILLGVAVLFIILQPNEETSKHASNQGAGVTNETDRFNPTITEGNPGGNIGTNSTKESDKTAVVEISGLGSIPYKRFVREMDLNDILYKCDLLTEGRYETRKRTGTKTVADIYFNEKGEIVHMSHGKGLYQTHSRDREAMASLDRDDMPGGGGMRIVEIGIPGLTLDNIPLLKSFLGLSTIRSATKPDNPRLEVELTPIIVEVSENFQGDPKYIGRRFPMLLEKYASGRLSANEYREDFIEFEPKQIVRRTWRLEPFLPDPEDAEGRTPRIGGGGPFDEPLLEAWYAKYGTGNKPEEGISE